MSSHPLRPQLSFETSHDPSPNARYDQQQHAHHQGYSRDHPDSYGPRGDYEDPYASHYTRHEDPFADEYHRSPFPSPGLPYNNNPPSPRKPLLDQDERLDFGPQQRTSPRTAHPLAHPDSHYQNLSYRRASGGIASYRDERDDQHLAPSPSREDHPRALTPGPPANMRTSPTPLAHNSSSHSLALPTDVSRGHTPSGAVRGPDDRYWNPEMGYNPNSAQTPNQSRGGTPQPWMSAGGFSSDPHQSYDESRYLQERFGRDTNGSSVYSSHYGGRDIAGPSSLNPTRDFAPHPSHMAAPPIMAQKGSMSTIASSAGGSGGPFRDGHGYMEERAPRPPGHGGAPYAHSNASGRILNTGGMGDYQDNPYKRYSTTWDPMLASTVGFDGTNDVLVDDDFDERPRGGAGGAAGGAAAGGALGAIKRASQTLLPSRNSGNASGSGGNGGTPVGGVGVGLMSGAAVAAAGGDKKSEWLEKKDKSRKRTKWIIVGVILLLALIGGGAAAGILLTQNKGGGGSSSGGKQSSGSSENDLLRQASPDDDKRGLLNKNSPEIKALMNNKKLKKVFHGIDYTPMGTQYPECHIWPPSQNNVTRDMAVMSQLTDKLRLYGNDCQQTEMVITAIEKLEVDMKIWVGVWLDKNATTNARQLNELWSLLDNWDSKHFLGVAVGNEALYREDMTEWELVQILKQVRSEMKKRSIDLPIGSSDLGSNWSPTFAAEVDVVMANVHPFFGGVKAEVAAEWTDTFFENNNVAIAKAAPNKPRVMISEVGWPSEGGRKGGSVAGVEELNVFMKDFVCTENKKGTEYFWFSAFDEPWKVRYNSPAKGEEWEDKWGLMDVNRNVKEGLEIPDCK